MEGNNNFKTHSNAVLKRGVGGKKRWCRNGVSTGWCGGAPGSGGVNGVTAEGLKHGGRIGRNF